MQTISKRLVGLMVFLSTYYVISLIAGAGISLFLVSLHLVIIPLIFTYSKVFRHYLVFLNCMKWPIYPDFEEPSRSGVEGGRNFYVEHKSVVDDCDIKLGVWHILPLSLSKSLNSVIAETKEPNKLGAIFNEELASSGKPIFIYCHGNANHRAAHHRIKLYRLLQRMDAHVIAFDYRGYGDSTNVHPTEDGVVEDALVVYDWLRTIIDKCDNPPPVFIWGHSLGTGISSTLMGSLEQISRKYLNKSLAHPDGFILEAPFSSLWDEVAGHWMTKLVKWLPYYEATFLRPFFKTNEFEFKSDEHLVSIRSLPILILHAKDDYVVPYRLGVKLYECIATQRTCEDAPIKLHSYEKSHGFGHIWLCEAPDLEDIVGYFVDSSCLFSKNRRS